MQLIKVRMSLKPDSRKKDPKEKMVPVQTRVKREVIEDLRKLAPYAIKDHLFKGSDDYALGRFAIQKLRDTLAKRYPMALTPGDTLPA